MIIVELCGGLGNQLFQYAFGRTIEKNYQVFYDKNWYQKKRKAHETLKLEKLGIKVDYHDKKFPKDFIFNIKLLRLLNKIFNRISGFKIIKELSWNGIINDNAYYVGFWQSGEYADSISEELIKIKNDCRNDQDIVDIISSIDKNSVCIHVRRGDYLTNKNLFKYSHLSYIQGDEYYIGAIKNFIEFNSNSNFHVFSDDIEWCKLNLTSATNKIIFYDGLSDISSFK